MSIRMGFVVSALVATFVAGCATPQAGGSTGGATTAAAPTPRPAVLTASVIGVNQKPGKPGWTDYTARFALINDSDTTLPLAVKNMDGDVTTTDKTHYPARFSRQLGGELILPPSCRSGGSTNTVVWGGACHSYDDTYLPAHSRARGILAPGSGGVTQDDFVVQYSVPSSIVPASIDIAGLHLDLTAPGAFNFAPPAAVAVPYTGTLKTQGELTIDGLTFDAGRGQLVANVAFKSQSRTADAQFRVNASLLLEDGYLAADACAGRSGFTVADPKTAITVGPLQTKVTRACFPARKSDSPSQAWLVLQGDAAGVFHP